MRKERNRCSSTWVTYRRAGASPAERSSSSDDPGWIRRKELGSSQPDRRRRPRENGVVRKGSSALTVAAGPRTIGTPSPEDASFDQSLAGSGSASLSASGVAPTLSDPAPALVTSTSAPAVVDVALAHRVAVTEGRVRRGPSARSASYRPSTAPTPATQVLQAVRGPDDDHLGVQTWLCSRVPFLITSEPFTRRSWRR